MDQLPLTSSKLPKQADTFTASKYSGLSVALLSCSWTNTGLKAFGA